MQFLDCRGCSQPLKPPVFQCDLGHPHFLCSACHLHLPESKCRTCSGIAFRPCPAMEDVINTVLLPCKHGCEQNITYYGKKEHEKVCKEGPCFCPEPGCPYRAHTAALFDHFAYHHKWPARNYGDSVRGDVFAVPGIHVLRSKDGHLFLLKVASLESCVLKVSVVSVQPNTQEPTFGCSFSYDWGTYNSQNVWLDKITNSSLSDGFPEDCFCILPSVLGAATPVLKGVFITKHVDDDDQMEWEDDDDDTTSAKYEYDEAEDDTTSDEYEDDEAEDEDDDDDTTSGEYEDDEAEDDHSD